MDGIHPFIALCMGICLIVLCFILFEEKCIKVVAQAIVGCLVIYCINQIVPQYAIGINAVSIACGGLLGVPGVTLLYILNSLV
ncbi:hypothetical protein CS063_12885 [Sporanaerobium hydrogeniformans]|uniref:Uncharacterized protein n=1 Tax=Sporanaerobium hydrogeniformans TaxID=3072179 RepID=A0AC61D9W6_9FIRM|nr:pro-sigmaK processing inhibitor BofA family protein [Sporanaerobium hydrogeniformans]PHV70034.1 hypothetical protein CS063_12885 [Sporanaerobium hydrogeniformans]